MAGELDELIDPIVAEDQAGQLEALAG
jgi:protein subunit release factor A